MSKSLPSPSCVVKVGDGRGFIISHRVKLRPLKLHLKHLQRNAFVDERLVVTAAHCLPKLPPAHGAAFAYERTYKDLLATLDSDKKLIYAECLFADPVADIAVLGPPDGQTFFDDETDAYFRLTDNATVLRIGKARNGMGWVLALDGHWIRTKIETHGAFETSLLTIDATEAGMSGSPILNNAGRAVGVVTLGRECGGRKERASGQPILARNLPGWLLK